MYNRFVLILLLTLCAYTTAAQRVITGKVLGFSDNLPLPGVTVILRGTTTGTSTDLQGSYSIQVPDSGAVLIFRYLGYQPLEVQIGKNNTESILLRQEVNVLLEFALLCYFPSNHLRLKLISGVNHLHYGFSAKMQLAYLNHPFGIDAIGLRTTFIIQHQFFANNRQTYFRAGRFDNFRISKLYFDTDIEVANRKIQIAEVTLDLQEFALINSVKSNFGLIGLGIGVQTEQFENSTRESYAIVAEWEKTFDNRFTSGFQLKRWRGATQLKWGFVYSIMGSHFQLGLNGIHLQDFNELSVGLSYGFSL